VLDVRVYRTAFIPALVAIFVAAFALGDRPAAVSATLSADAFNGDRAFGSPSDPDSLLGLARAFPVRETGSPADARMADEVARVFSQTQPGQSRPAFQVQRLTTRARTTSGSGNVEVVIGTRPGLSSRRIVVVAHRDAVGRGALADLSGTAALLELARVYATRELDKTLVLVSTSAATTGFAGARAWARASAGEPVDGVIVLGDMAGTRIAKPWVVSFASDGRSAPLLLERTVQAALRTETTSDPGAPRAAAQWLRRALPISVSEQAPIAAAGLPAVLVSESGERGPRASEPVLETRLQSFGSGVLRAITALDQVHGAVPEGQRGIVTLRNVLPDWAVRLAVGMLLLPALLAALDAYFRARRRRVPVASGLRWIAIAAVPLLGAWAWLRLLGLVNVTRAVDGPVLPAAFPLTAAAWVSMLSALLAGALLCWLARALVGTARRARAGTDGLGIATGLVICALATVLWFVNPYAAALLVPAAHLWLFASGGWRGWPAIVALVGGLLLPLLTVLYFMTALALGPVKLAWASALVAAGGGGLRFAIVLTALVAALAGLVRTLVLRTRAERAGDDRPAPLVTRGPASYAGPGLLGGTESALRR